MKRSEFRLIIFIRNHYFYYMCVVGRNGICERTNGRAWGAAQCEEHNVKDKRDRKLCDSCRKYWPDCKGLYWHDLFGEPVFFICYDCLDGPKLCEHGKKYQCKRCKYLEDFI